jgi:hypothetical protein
VKTGTGLIALPKGEYLVLFQVEFSIVTEGERPGMNQITGEFARSDTQSIFFNLIIPT